ncbi:MAG: hypothetical protein RR355_06030 [Oscillospiraceae bacterium]
MKFSKLSYGRKTKAIGIMLKATPIMNVIKYDNIPLGAATVSVTKFISDNSKVSVQKVKIEYDANHGFLFIKKYTVPTKHAKLRMSITIPKTPEKTNVKLNSVAIMENKKAPHFIPAITFKIFGL